MQEKHATPAKREGEKKNDPSKGKKKVLKETQITEVFALASKDFKRVIINMCKKLKENMIKIKKEMEDI